MSSVPAVELAPHLTYEPRYGLREKPFSLAADPRFLYRSQDHARAFDQLLAGIQRREGLVVVTGETGTGKTTLCRAVLEQLDRRTVSTFVQDPFLTREELLKALLVGFGAVSASDLRNRGLAGASRQDLLVPLHEFLDSLVPLQASAVIVVDEAQNLALSVVEELRILGEREVREKVVQVVLVGQPELRRALKTTEMRQVDQRVAVRCELGPLPAGEVGPYINHRLTVASGETACRVAFSREAVDLVERASGGVPRVVNLICDRSLHLGLSASLDVIGIATLSAALGELQLDSVPSPRPRERQALVTGGTEDLLSGAPVTAVTLENVPEALRQFSKESKGASRHRTLALALGALVIAAAVWTSVRHFTGPADPAPPEAEWDQSAEALRAEADANAEAADDAFSGEGAIETDGESIDEAVEPDVEADEALAEDLPSQDAPVR